MTNVLIADTSGADDGGELVGRGGELTELSDFLDGAAARGGARLLVGDPGVGKTRVLQAAAAMAVQKGFQILTASPGRPGAGRR
ncbi:ATP-binding protein [Nocardia fusca]|uniref:ATP-binding protein n=1 Tax=Nocardia fusca TaxID=941183 RepID=UPI0007A757B0|nr:ATP-binding protein [Nocardia fusca]